MTALAGRLLDVLGDERAVPNLRSYFTEFEGRHFQALGGGGDRPESRDRITAEDLVALRTLGVAVPGETAADLLEGPLSRRVSDLLRAIPTSVALGQPEAAALIGDRSQADVLWDLFRAQDGLGWVGAGTLLARKRPRLIPVYDEVARCVLHHPEDVWRSFHDALGGAPEVLRRVRELRAAAPVPEHVSDLRVIDVTLWMWHHTAHRHGKRMLR
ncbi:hypothetical protein EKO23_19345 [Nocardioides guangzhouensis]|uniref:Uncharacterized protein n=1 Tax=Nocardioides guangzhouensis TaxID=2497878 RepID=A0A4Q4Z6A4_9ACTN|nr:DUF6308 family protein [Nocardioides guangzhouensis]RYP83327.1 hypothetical protein EKO23_19345 [Nocardioides guangzhouensis]